MLARIAAIGWLGFVQLLRGRIYLNLVVAGVALVLTALAFDRVSGGEGARVLTDIGLAFASLVVVALAGTSAIVAVTREIETRQVHLVLARPVSRAEFVLGRFTTVALLVISANLLLGVVLAGLVEVFDGYGLRVFAAFLLINGEGFIVTGLAILFGVGSSSTMSALFTTTLFVLGRLSLLLREALDAGKLKGPFEPVLEVAYQMLPHLDLFDLSVFAHGGEAPAWSLMARVVAYGVAYTGMLLSIAVWRFQRRDLL